MAPQNTPEKKIWIHGIEKYLDPQTTHKKKNWPIKYPREKFRTHKISTRKHFGPTKYLREKIFGPTKYSQENMLDPRNTHKKKFWTNKIPTKIRWYDGTRPTRTAMTHDPQNLKHSSSNDYIVRISPSQMFCKISVLQNSQKNNCARISFLIKLQVEKLLKNYKKTPEPKSLSK